jgi:hypothetical protein
MRDTYPPDPRDAIESTITPTPPHTPPLIGLTSTTTANLSTASAIPTVTIGRTCYHARVHLAILHICDTRALDAPDRGTLAARHGLLFMAFIAFCLYDTHRVRILFVRYALCYDLCTRRAVRDDIV